MNWPKSRVNRRPRYSQKKIKNHIKYQPTEAAEALILMESSALDIFFAFPPVLLGPSRKMDPSSNDTQ